MRTAPSHEKLAHAGSLTSGLVHELRNPLNAIKANLQLMEEDMVREESGEGPHTRRVRRLLKEVGRLDRILSDFLAFVREPEFEFERTDLSALLQEVATLLTPQADELGIVILSDLDDNVSARVDEEAMKQALMNLAINGIQAMTAKGTLMLRVKRDRDRAAIDVIDTGRGIPEQERERIFDLFYTSREGGTGIGLAVVAKIVRAHQGEITCSSEIGKGTSFRILLPLEK